VIDVDNNDIIIITPSSGKELRCNYSYIVIKHHFYTSDSQPYNLSLKYINPKNKSNVNDSNISDFEMILRFDNLEQMSSFESVRCIQKALYIYIY